mmetsp:Transcript_36997/g.95966  ORF Transcript_36997/g.95966 Transcript_36997/m.95966 type:complete len:201 (-) Transcript_36997:903-1505(-)
MLVVPPASAPPMRSSSVRFRFSCLGASSAPSGALPLDAGAGAAGAGVARLRPLVPPTTPRSTTFAAGASPPRPPLRPPNCVNAFLMSSLVVAFCAMTSFSSTSLSRKSSSTPRMSCAGAAASVSGGCARSPSGTRFFSSSSLDSISFSASWQCVKPSSGSSMNCRARAILKCREASLLSDGCSSSWNIRRACLKSVMHVS